MYAVLSFVIVRCPGAIGRGGPECPEQCSEQGSPGRALCTKHLGCHGAPSPGKAEVRQPHCVPSPGSCWGPGGGGSAVLETRPLSCLCRSQDSLGTCTSRSREGWPWAPACVQPGLAAESPSRASRQGKYCFSCPSPSFSWETAFSLLFKTV